jgi:hypothetical protein
MRSLTLYRECLKLSPRDPNYIPALEEAAREMALSISELLPIVHKQIDELQAKQDFES